MFEKEKQDIMSAEEILDELRKLVESEKSENEPGSTEDASLLEDAIQSIEKFIGAEEKESPDSSLADRVIPADKTAGAIDTGVLTGPIGGLKSFLIKKSQDNAAQ
jgi:hypothetical protein